MLHTESLVTKEFEIVRYDISGLPKKYQANAKLQLLGNSFVKLTPLSASFIADNLINYFRESNSHPQLMLYSIVQHLPLSDGELKIRGLSFPYTKRHSLLLIEISLRPSE
jgi:hypothetical protein